MMPSHRVEGNGNPHGDAGAMGSTKKDDGPRGH